MAIPRIDSPLDHGQLKLPHHVVCLALDQGQMLDVTGPLEVFSRTERLLRDKGWLDETAYIANVASLEKGPVSMSSGIALTASVSIFEDFQVDTLVLAGGIGVDNYLDRPDLVARIRQLSERAERVVSICNGCYLLAESGLLNGRKATTHWNHSQRFRERYPQVDLQIDQIFCQDEKFYSSGGVTAGIDLALHLVQQDFGQKAALEAAKQLVLYLRRPGGQNQFSSLLVSQVAESSALHEVVHWISENYQHKLSVSDLAAKAAMSPRNFSRRFSEETGFSPAKFIERIRVEQAMRLLEETNSPLESIASQCGISSAEQLGQIFSRVLKVSPKFYRQRFRT